MPQHIKTREFWLLQRAAWINKAPVPAPERIQMQANYDRQRNPHNDSHKPPLRSEPEILADLAMSFADEVMRRIYGVDYQEHQQRHLTFNGKYHPEAVNLIFRGLDEHEVTK